VTPNETIEAGAKREPKSKAANDARNSNGRQLRWLVP
jgi:hypothetical protein